MIVRRFKVMLWIKEQLGYQPHATRYGIITLIFANLCRYLLVDGLFISEETISLLISVSVLLSSVWTISRCKLTFALPCITTHTYPLLCSVFKDIAALNMLNTGKLNTSVDLNLVWCGHIQCNWAYKLCVITCDLVINWF